MVNKDKMPVVIGVAFVWFTTQFGGGFASGNQLRQYFVQFGVWAFATCIIAQFIGAFYQWYALKYAKKHEVYDYKSFNDSFYGKYSFIFSNLYERFISSPSAWRRLRHLQQALAPWRAPLGLTIG